MVAKHLQKTDVDCFYPRDSCGSRSDLPFNEVEGKPNSNLAHVVFLFLQSERLPVVYRHKFSQGGIQLKISRHLQRVGNCKPSFFRICSIACMLPNVVGFLDKLWVASRFSSSCIIDLELSGKLAICSTLQARPRGPRNRTVRAPAACQMYPPQCQKLA